MNKAQLKQKIETAKWFGMLNYDDYIFVSQNVNNVLQESQFADNAEELLETNFFEDQGCYIIDEYAFTIGDTKNEVVKKLKKMISNVREV
jgi:hypothetical protein